MHQNFLKGVVHAIIIDQWNQASHSYEIQVTVIYRRVSLWYHGAVQGGLSMSLYKS